jgi:hypothetical protein
MTDQLKIYDLRPQLDLLDRPLCRRRRRGEVTSITLHYNGPALRGFGNPQAELRRVVEVDTPNHQRRLHADSLMCHFVVLSDGSIWQSRDLELQAWHCGNAEGNEQSLAVYLPLGGVQDATAAQWVATTQLCAELIAEHNLPGRQAVKGHLEWSPTACPGPLLMSRLRAWRAVAAGEPFSGGVFRIKADVGAANVRLGPDRRFPVALGGQAVMWPGDLLNADETVLGESIGGEQRWAHRSDGLGFVHLSMLDAVG